MLLPAVLELLGERASWLPRWLDERLPHFDVEGGPVEPAAGAESEPSADARREREPVPAQRAR